MKLDKTNGWPDWVMPICVGLGFVLLYRYAIFAVTDIGNLFGWMIGASKSPIAAAVSPLVFGLLSTVVFLMLAKVATSASEAMSVQMFRRGSRNLARPSSRKANAKLLAHLASAIILLHLTTWFIYATRVGIHHGSKVREAASKATEVDRE